MTARGLAAARSRDTGLGIEFRGICSFLHLFLVFLLFLMTSGSRGAGSASRDSKTVSGVMDFVDLQSS